jgi:hypothetical protein
MTNINEAAADLFAITAQIKALTAKADELKALLKENGSFTNDGYCVKVTTTERTTIDTAMLKAKYEPIALACSKTTSVTSVTVKKV